MQMKVIILRPPPELNVSLNLNNNIDKTTSNKDLNKILKEIEIILVFN